MTLQQAAQLALDVQDGVNLSGILRSFSEVVLEVIWPEARSRGFRKRKTCKNKEHSQPCFCLNLKRAIEQQKEQPVCP